MNTPITGIDTGGQHVIVLPAARETGHYEWKAGRFDIRLSCGAVCLGMPGGEIDMNADAAEALGAALGAAAHALRNQPPDSDVRALAARLAAVDPEWHGVDPGDRHYEQAARLLRAFTITSKEEQA